MSTGNRPADPEDMFSDTRMSFGDHIEELRTHLWRAIWGFLFIMVMVFVLDALGTVLDNEHVGVGRPALKFIAKPVEEQLQKFYQKRFDKMVAEKEKDAKLQRLNELKPVELVFPPEAFAKLGLPPPEVEPGQPGIVLPVQMRPLDVVIALRDAEQTIIKRPALTTLSAQEAFMVYFKVALVCGFVLGSPWIFWQIWMFVAAGMYANEKRYVHIYLPFSLFLFLAGVFICEFFVIPKALEALLWFNEWIGLEPDLRLNEWLSFAIMMPLVFGVSFQTPLVMFFLERLGIMTIEIYRNKRRMAWFVLAVFAAVITPSVDAVSMLFLWLPLGLLYELGIFMCRMSPRPADTDIDVPDSEELIEV